jgi:hypothetical protein
MKDFVFQDKGAFRLAMPWELGAEGYAPPYAKMPSTYEIRTRLDFRTKGRSGWQCHGSWASRAMKSITSVKAWISGHPCI